MNLKYEGHWQKDIGVSRQTAHGRLHKQIKRWRKGILPSPTNTPGITPWELAEQLQREHEEALRRNCPNTADQVRQAMGEGAN